MFNLPAYNYNRRSNRRFYRRFRGTPGWTAGVWGRVDVSTASLRPYLIPACVGASAAGLRPYIAPAGAGRRPVLHPVIPNFVH